MTETLGMSHQRVGGVQFWPILASVFRQGQMECELQALRLVYQGEEGYRKQSTCVATGGIGTWDFGVCSPILGHKSLLNWPMVLLIKRLF